MPYSEYPGEYLGGVDAIDYNPKFSDLIADGDYTKKASTEAIYAMDNGINLVIDGTKLTYSSDGSLTGGTITSLKLVVASSGKLMQSVTGLSWSGQSFHTSIKNGDYYYAASVGLNGSDTLNGSAGADELWGYGGNDILNGGAGDDNLVGGRGKDTYDGGAGFNQLDFEDTYKDPTGAHGVTVNMATGKDTDPWGNVETFKNIQRIKGTQFVDNLTGSNGDDQFRPLGGADIVNGGAGNDTIMYDRDYQHGGNRAVTVDLSAGYGIDGFGAKDKLTSIENVVGTSYADHITGSSVANVLKGGDGNDVIKGGAGADTLIGQGGADQLYGGTGNDTFVYQHLTDSTVAASGRDTIYDLTAGDKIDVSATDANKNVSGNQTFTFIGTGAFTGSAGQLRYDKQAADTYIYADVNGDKKADFEIHLTGSIALTKSFFVL